GEAPGCKQLHHLARFDAAHRRAYHDEIGSARFEYRIEIGHSDAFERGEAELLHTCCNECSYRAPGVCDADARRVRPRCERGGLDRVLGSLLFHAPPPWFVWRILIDETVVKCENRQAAPTNVPTASTSI